MTGDVHILPIDDLRAHEETRDCWCRPTLQRHVRHAVDRGVAIRIETIVVVHNSADGRELVEEHGVN